jgi:hypothetical protein
MTEKAKDEMLNILVSSKVYPWNNGNVAFCLWHTVLVILASVATARRNIRVRALNH